MKTLRPAILCAFTSIFIPGGALAEFSAQCGDLFAGERLTLVVPNSPGGGYDTYSRALAPVLEKHGGLTARVTNMPGGGGNAARSFVMNSDAESLVLLIENTADLVTSPMGNIGRGALAEKDFTIAGYRIVGILHSEASAWVARDGLDLFSPDLGTLVASEGSLEEALLPVFVAGLALGIDMDAVTGYDGTGEMGAAILRGEADITSASLTTTKRLAQNEGLEVNLVLSDGPAPSDPDLPFLAGEGSVVWDLTAGIPEAEATYRRSLAAAVAGLRGAARGMFVSVNLDADRAACMAELMDLASADPEFAEAAEAQGRPVAPIPAAEASELVASLIASHAAALPTLEAIAAEKINE